MDLTPAQLAPSAFERNGHERHDHGEADPGGPAHSHLKPGQWLLRSLLFGAMGAYFLGLWLTGGLGNYINARFVWLSVVAAIILFVLTLSCAYAFLRSRFGKFDLAYGYHDLTGHMHPRVTIPMLMVLAAPVVFGVLVPSKPLGASAVGGDLMPNAPADNVVGASANSLEWSVVDWLRVFYYIGNPDRLNNREADVIGFVYRREGDPKGHFMVARFVMSCCSADASAVGMPVAWGGADNLPVDKWVHVRGPVKVQQFGKNALPVIEAKSVQDMDGPPPQPYLYP
jgi:uncharacterized repeat protein (TIGR03943 family)